MKIIRKLDDIRALKSDRVREIKPVPDSFRDDSYGFVAGCRHRLTRPFRVSGTATFENAPVTIDIEQMRGERPAFSGGATSLPLEPEHAIKGLHNIQLGDVKIIEHPLAMMSALGLDLDFKLDQPSFPTFEYCNREYLEASRGLFAPGEALRRFTVREPIALGFDEGYLILEPDEGDGELVIDHQIAYPGRSVGQQRIVAPITPEFFCFFGAARTPSFRPRAEAEQLFALAAAGQLKNYPFHPGNVLLVDEDRHYNPRSEFVFKDHNYEFILHELIDVLAWFKFPEAQLGGRFAGRMSAYRFDHHAQIDAALYFCNPGETAFPGFEFE